MHLDKWVQLEGYGTLSWLARRTGLAYGTVFAAYRRTTKVTYQTKENVAKRRNIGLAISLIRT